MQEFQDNPLGLIHFVADEAGTFHRVLPESVEAVWAGEEPVSSLPVPIGGELRLAFVLCDADQQPAMTFFLRLQVCDDAIDRDSRIAALRALTEHQGRRYDSPDARYQLEGWPTDWRTQLAVALDVPARQFRRLGIGGPLLMSELWGVPVEQIVAYFESARRT
ncbi:hypothetical protein [Maioricimonas sp. JC845]|uniref:hypothetical protein n=1 Tax=Maioricimonas sp. JC845 TaxID=3232138 RepID=UPI0034599538